MGKKGWWLQLQSDDYPGTQISYGQDMQALRGETFNGLALGVLENSHRPTSKKIYDREYISNQYKKRSTHSMECPKCGSKMVLRTAMKGPHAGRKFWGCSKFPKCRETVSFTK